ncbi:hypothetical protein ACIRD8_09960 [Streptomyces sp. NPDC102451]|uniref:hypothetical protein n=1 Tax=Streptomyces sp. NPDC102451 TaxID=3366177 RepID=UPI00380611B3
MPIVIFAVERYLEWKFGVMSTFAASLLIGGLKSGSGQCATAGAVLLAVLVVGTAL